MTFKLENYAASAIEAALYNAGRKTEGGETFKAAQPADALAFIARVEAYLVNMAELCETNRMEGSAGNCTTLARQARIILGTATADDIARDAP